MKLKGISLASLLMLTTMAEPVLAKVSMQEASELGKELTQLGAQKSANASGTIPAYTGGLAQDKNADPFQNIYENEKPLFIITAENLSKYEKNLTPGQKALFKKYPKSYSMPIYQTHRTASYPKIVLDKAKRNASTADIKVKGSGIINFDETVPFAIPKNGLEVIWNHKTRFKGGSVELNQNFISVESDGSYLGETGVAYWVSPWYLKEGYDAKKDDNILFYYRGKTKTPVRLSGDIYLVHETLDQEKQPRKAWMYSAGQRRVRRAPQLGFDAPDVDGLRTIDQVDQFNGSPDRYNWELVGKKEIYIPYNSYKLADRDSKYKDMIGAGHINREYTRYELHRVWHVQATLKKGYRHIYQQRDLYVDEDSWQISLADHYDSRGDLWRVSEGHAMQFVNAKTLHYVGEFSYDLMSGRYLAQLSNEEKNSFDFDLKLRRKDFSTGAIRRSGKR